MNQRTIRNNPYVRKMIKQINLFFKLNWFVFVCVLSGIIIGYIYWYYWGIYYGTLPLSSVCWVNCTYGGLIGGFLGSLIKE
ncbi:putative membrane protein [Proteiniphilum saccharofermentans]|uniref:Putative membrane protein n=1 Tax=Proteiniphilum saccharofermentans TaxID=1642647 RepID=A0A1R3SZT9_9BACT|nr:putative membrane protein [Proteiniphilum saccharofermentans]